MRLVFFLAAMVGLVSSCSPSAPIKETHQVLPLDGSAWDVVVTPDEAAAKKGEKVFKDTLLFDDGRATMTTCLKYGFTASPYSAAKLGQKWSLKTRQVSPQQGSSNWDAEIDGDVFKGTMICRKNDGTALNYTFVGKKSGG